MDRRPCLQRALITSTGATRWVRRSRSALLPAGSTVGSKDFYIDVLRNDAGLEVAGHEDPAA